jgi:hypothetical protein
MEVRETKTYTWKIGKDGSVHYRNTNDTILVSGSFSMMGVSTTIISIEDLLQFAEAFIEAYKIAKAMGEK